MCVFVVNYMYIYIYLYYTPIIRLLFHPHVCKLEEFLEPQTRDGF